MNLVVDCRYTRIGHHDGISRFTAGLVAELGRRQPVTMLISDHRQLELLPNLPWQLISAPTSPLEPFVARQVRKLRPDVVFSPMQTMGSRGRNYRLILTLHDLIYYVHRTPPRDLPAPVRLLWRLFHLAWWPQRMLLNGADAVATVSQTTADLIRQHRLTTKPIGVVPNAADGLPLPPLPRTKSLTRTLIYMGAFAPYKGVETLVQAMAELPGYELHLLSRISESDRERLQQLAPNAALVFHNGVSDAKYAELLGSATALVHASHDEGFGIPLVEAMRAGTPVVVSDIPIFREIAGDAGVFFPVGDAAGLVAAVQSLEGGNTWEQRSEASVARAANYTWAKAADALLELIAATDDPLTAKSTP
ncbi:MAG TPA: glycosyltransferase family 1 protein [Candidatus Lumbricidophila sp.]|nr:glycosyltransferase family 1 protein [Candidatus Lumbricidophila sp.]